MSIIQRFARLNLLPVWKRRIRVWGFALRAPSLDRLAALYLHRAGWMGKAEEQLFEHFIKPGMTVVDVGANQGLYTLLFSRLVGPGGTVIAFEPETDMYRALAENVRHNGTAHVELYQVALGSQSGPAMLSRSLIHGGDHRLAPGHHQSVSQKELVTVRTLDEVLGERRVDFVKMDVQGWEAEVWRGMDHLLMRQSHLTVYFEFWPRGLRQAGDEPAELLRRLVQQGFQVFEHSRGKLQPVHEFAPLIDRLSGHRFTNLLAQR
jgi:FkbM family methyltransferase